MVKERQDITGLNSSPRPPYRLALAATVRSSMIATWWSKLIRALVVLPVGRKPN